SGKSTLVNLALRFFDPDRGKVMIDGQDITTVKIDSLRDSIALVTQDPVLFDDTVRANIAYGAKPVDEAQVIAAARAVQPTISSWLYPRATILASAKPAACSRAASGSVSPSLERSTRMRPSFCSMSRPVRSIRKRRRRCRLLSRS